MNEAKSLEYISRNSLFEATDEELQLKNKISRIILPQAEKSLKMSSPSNLPVSLENLQDKIYKLDKKPPISDKLSHRKKNEKEDFSESVKAFDYESLKNDLAEIEERLKATRKSWIYPGDVEEPPKQAKLKIDELKKDDQYEEKEKVYNEIEETNQRKLNNRSDVTSHSLKGGSQTSDDIENLEASNKEVVNNFGNEDVKLIINDDKDEEINELKDENFNTEADEGFLKWDYGADIGLSQSGDDYIMNDRSVKVNVNNRQAQYFDEHTWPHALPGTRQIANGNLSMSQASFLSSPDPDDRSEIQKARAKAAFGGSGTSMSKNNSTRKKETNAFYNTYFSSLNENGDKTKIDNNESAIKSFSPYTASTLVAMPYSTISKSDLSARSILEQAEAAEKRLRSRLQQVKKKGLFEEKISQRDSDKISASKSENHFETALPPISDTAQSSPVQTTHSNFDDDCDNESPVLFRSIVAESTGIINTNHIGVGVSPNKSARSTARTPPTIITSASFDSEDCLSPVSNLPQFRGQSSHNQYHLAQKTQSSLEKNSKDENTGEDSLDTNTSTVESTHPNSNDAQPPKFHPDAYGSRESRSGTIRSTAKSIAAGFSRGSPIHRRSATLMHPSRSPALETISSYGSVDDWMIVDQRKAANNNPDNDLESHKRKHFQNKTATSGAVKNPDQQQNQNSNSTGNIKSHDHNNRQSSGVTGRNFDIYNRSGHQRSAGINNDDNEDEESSHDYDDQTETKKRYQKHYAAAIGQSKAATNQKLNGSIRNRRASKDNPTEVSMIDSTTANSEYFDDEESTLNGASGEGVEDETCVDDATHKEEELDLYLSDDNEFKDSKALINDNAERNGRNSASDVSSINTYNLMNRINHLLASDINDANMKELKKILNEFQQYESQKESEFFEEKQNITEFPRTQNQHNVRDDKLKTRYKHNNHLSLSRKGDQLDSRIYQDPSSQNVQPQTKPQNEPRARRRHRQTHQSLSHRYSARRRHPISHHKNRRTLIMLKHMRLKHKVKILEDQARLEMRSRKLNKIEEMIFDLESGRNHYSSSTKSIENLDTETVSLMDENDTKDEKLSFEIPATQHVLSKECKKEEHRPLKLHKEKSKRTKPVKTEYEIVNEYNTAGRQKHFEDDFSKQNSSTKLKKDPKRLQNTYPTGKSWFIQLDSEAEKNEINEVFSNLEKIDKKYTKASGSLPVAGDYQSIWEESQYHEKEPFDQRQYSREKRHYNRNDPRHLDSSQYNHQCCQINSMKSHQLPNKKEILREKQRIKEQTACLSHECRKQLKQMIGSAHVPAEDEPTFAENGLSWFEPMPVKTKAVRPEFEEDCHLLDKAKATTSLNRDCCYAKPNHHVDGELQEIFRQQMHSFISRSEMRQRRVRLAAEERQYQNKLNEERKRLLLQANSPPKRPSASKLPRKPIANQIRLKPMQHRANQKDSVKLNENCIKNLENKGQINRKAMKKDAARKYQQLPEVTKRRDDRRKQAIIYNNRVRMQLYGEKILRSLFRQRSM